MSPFPPAPGKHSLFLALGGSFSHWCPLAQRRLSCEGQTWCLDSARRPRRCPSAPKGHFCDGEGATLCYCNAPPSFMAFTIHKPLHYTDDKGVGEALQLPTQIVVPNNATSEALGLDDLFQPRSKALSVPMAE